MKTKHHKAVELMKKLNEYCQEGNCKQCVFACLGNCPFYMLDEDNFELLKKEARRLSGGEKDGTAEH